MTTAIQWFKFVAEDGCVYVGPVQGCGGMIQRSRKTSGGRLAVAVRRARLGRSTGIYEPQRGCVTVYPNYAASGNGEPIVVDLTTCRWCTVNPPR